MVCRSGTAIIKDIVHRQLKTEPKHQSCARRPVESARLPASRRFWLPVRAASPKERDTAAHATQHVGSMPSPSARSPRCAPRDSTDQGAHPSSGSSQLVRVKA